MTRTPEYPIALPRALALHLAHQRDRHGLTQRQVAARVGVARHVVCAWENGHRSPTLGHLITWADALGYEIALRPKTPAAMHNTNRKGIAA